MSQLFKPLQIGPLEIKNRFIHSATYEVMGSATGEVTEALIKRYQRLAKNEVGMMIAGYMCVHPSGRAYNYQTGIDNDAMIPGLTKLADGVHENGGKIIFQIAHAGRQTKKEVIGQTPIGPSSKHRDPANFLKPKEMTEDEINTVIDAFEKSAVRAAKAGADGLQLHGAHGYLINQFLSPFLNQRTDHWGGSDENRFRFLKKIIIKTKAALPDRMPLMIKLNVNDYTPQAGVVPKLAATYAKWMADLGIDLIEVSCGNGDFAPFNIFRGEVPVPELLMSIPWWKKPLAKVVMNQTMAGKFDLEEGYNVDAAKQIKAAAGGIPISVVGGLRHLVHMEEVVEKGYADCVSMARPFIREPSIVKRFLNNKTDKVSCISCNRCVAAILLDKPVKCYQKGIPVT